MIELPTSPAPHDAVPGILDFGLPITGAAGGPSLRVDRPGSRYRVAVTFPPLTAEDARVFVARLIRGKTEGIRIPYPLLGVSQGSPGAPVVDGAGQAGKVINLRGCTPHHIFKEGFWISIGNATVPSAATRVVAAAKPMSEGLVEGDAQDWQLSLGDLVQIGFTIQEAA